MKPSASVWRSTWLHGGLLMLALVGAWLSFRRPFDDGPRTTARRPVAVQAAAGDVERVVYERPDRTLSIEAREDDLGRWFAGREGSETAFVGGRQVAEAWEALEPLRAVRILEDVEGDKLAELELAGDAAAGEFLVLTVRGREVRYRLGGRPFGGSDRYALREPDDDGDAAPAGRVLVLPSEITAGLGGGAGMLMERRLMAASRPDVEAMVLSRAGESSAERPAETRAITSGEPLRIVQRSGAHPADSYWTVGESDEADADIAAWVDKFFRLSVVAYRTGEPAAEWRAEARITVESREHGASTLEIWSAASGDDSVWFARSPFTRLVVELSASLAEEVCADLDGLL